MIPRHRLGKIDDHRPPPAEGVRPVAISEHDQKRREPRAGPVPEEVPEFHPYHHLAAGRRLGRREEREPACWCARAPWWTGPGRSCG